MRGSRCKLLRRQGTDGTSGSQRSRPVPGIRYRAADFLAAMYGDYTVRILESRIVDRYRDKNATLQHARNTSFSAIGQLSTSPTGPRVHTYENFFARIPLPFGILPGSIGVSRIEVDLAA